MALSILQSGTLTADGTEQQLGTTITTAGTYQLIVDIDAMVNADITEFRTKVKSFTGQTSKVLFFSTYAHDQGADGALLISPPIPAPIEIIFTLKQTAGTNRAYPWAIYSY